MSRRTRQVATPQIEAVRQRIEEWRATRAKRSPMPEVLWSAAAAAAREEGVYAASQKLGVNYGSLKARAGAGGRKSTGGPKSAARKMAARPAFVEIGVPVPMTSGPSGAVLELTRGDGTKLTIQLTSGDAVDWIGLAREFWGR